MKRGLFLVQLPPPVHGVSLVNRRIVDDLTSNDRARVDILSTAYSTQLADLNRFSIRKGLRWLRLLTTFTRRLLVDRPDFVYLTPVPTGLGFVRDAPFIALAKLARCRVIVHLHGRGIAERARSRAWLRLYRSVLANCALISASKGMRDREVAALGLRGARAYVVENAVERVEPDCYRAWRRPGDAPRLLFLSATFPFKGIFVLLCALRTLVDRGVCFRAELVGASTPEVDAQVRTEIAGSLADWVRALGPQYGEEKLFALGRADVFVHPTLNDYFPHVLLEAMQFGLPVVATNVGAIGEIVEHDCTGLIVPPGDANALADALERLIRDSNLRCRFGMQGHRRYLERYVPERFNAAMRAVLGAEGVL